MPGGQSVDQRVDLAQVMGLSGYQAEIDKVAERVRQGQYLCRYPSARGKHPA